MDLPSSITVLAATEKIDEPNTQVVFFIVGGALAVIAVLLSIVGLKRPDFPGGSAIARAVILLFVVLVAGTMFSAAYLAA